MLSVKSALTTAALSALAFEPRKLIVLRKWFDVSFFPTIHKKETVKLFLQISLSAFYT